MKIVDLTKEYEDLYMVCLEDWSDEMKECGNHKCNWYNKIKDKGLGVKLALDDNNQVGGMIQYVPIQYSEADGENIYFVKCIWVHGYKEGRGNFQGKGMGKAMLKAAEEDAKSRGASGMAAWGIPLPFWMSAAWFKKQGYKKVDKTDMQVLMWKPFIEEAQPPKWHNQATSPKAGLNPGKITITAFNNGWCQASNIVCERAKKAAEALGDNVIFNLIDTFERETFLKWGIADGLFIENKNINTGPPPSYDDIVKAILKAAKKRKITLVQ